MGVYEIKLNFFRLVQIWVAGFVIGSAALLWMIWIDTSLQSGQTMTITTNSFNEMWFELVMLCVFAGSVVYLAHRRDDLLADVRQYREQLFRRPIRMYTRKEGLRYYLERIDFALKKSHTVTVKVLGELQKALAPLQPIAKAGGTIGHETYDNVRKSQEKSFNIGDFGIREFNSVDDWIFMRPGKRE